MLQDLQFVRSGLAARVWKLALALGCAVVLAACGGGGGGGGGDDELTVSVDYNGAAFLLRSTSIRPTIDGLEGHSANCSLASGTLPSGMTLNADCSITGTPMQAGNFPVTVRLGASGVSNQLDWPVVVMVLGPSVLYQMPVDMNIGSSVDVRTLNNFWTPSAADTASYSIVGTLPPGLTIDSATGRIHGTPTSQGTYSFKVAVRLENGGRTVNQVQDSENRVTVVMPSINYDRNQAWVGLPFTSTPTLPGGNISYRFSTTDLPAGLALDPNTGVISGIPTTPQFPTDVTVAVTTSDPGGSYTTTTRLQLQCDSPVYIRYPDGRAIIGQPFSMSPEVINNSREPLNGIVFSYSLADHPLPPGLSLDRATGTISGTFPADYAGASSMSLTVNVTSTFNGVSLVMPAWVFMSTR